MKKIVLPMILLLLGFDEVFASAMFEGIVKPAHEVELALPIDGIVHKIFLKEGDLVRKGQSLLKLDDTLQKLEVERRKEIYNDSSEIEANKKNLAILKKLLESSRMLYEQTASVSHDEVQNLEMQYYTLHGRINDSEAKKRQQRIEYEISKEVLSRYTLTAPIDGVVTVIKREEGEWAKTGEMIVTIVDTSKCYVELDIDERYARTLSRGKIVKVEVNESNSVKAKKGTVAFVSPVADKASALMKVKVEFENKNSQVIPGVLANLIFD